jgi:hypothetical protein
VPRGPCTVAGLWCLADPPAEADSLAATGTFAAEDRPLLAVQRYDPHPAHVVIHACGTLAGLPLVRHS